MAIVKYGPFTARASALLPAGNAYDSTAPSIDTSAFSSLTFWPKYTPATTASGISVKAQVSPDGTTWYPAPIADSTLAKSGLAATITNYAETVTWPVTSGTTAIELAPFRIDVSDFLCARILAAETTQPGSRGTLAIAATATGMQ